MTVNEPSTTTRLAFLRPQDPSNASMLNYDALLEDAIDLDGEDFLTLHQQASKYGLNYTGFKMRYNTFCKDLAKEFDVTDIVERVTKIAFDAARFANLIAIKYLENGEFAAMKRFFKDPEIFRKIFNSMTLNDDGTLKNIDNETITEHRELYLSARSATVELQSGYKISIFVKEAAKTYLGNVKAHLKSNLGTRIGLLIRCRLFQRFPTVSTSVLERVSSYAADRIVKSKEIKANPPWWVFESVVAAEVRTQIMLYCQHLEPYIRKDLFADLPLYDDNQRQHWTDYIEPLYNIATEISVYNKSCRSERQLRIYSMLPVTKYSSYYIHIDTSGLFHLANPKDISFKEFIDPKNAFKNWDKYFDVKEGETKKRKFAYSVYTDGYAVFVVQTTLNKAGHQVDDYGRENERFVPLEFESDSKLIGLDPGIDDLFVTADDQNNVIHFSTKKFHANCKNHEFRCSIRKMNDSRPDIIKILRSVKWYGVSSQSWLDYIADISQSMKLLLEFYGTSKWKKLDFKAHTKRQSVFEDMLKLIAGGTDYSKVYIGFGDGSFVKNWKGGRCGPVLGFYEFLKHRLGKNVRKVDEFRTSAICSSCHNYFEEKQIQWGLKECRVSNCKVSPSFSLSGVCKRNN